MSSTSCHRQQLAEYDRRKVEHRDLIYYRAINTLSIMIKTALTNCCFQLSHAENCTQTICNKPCVNLTVPVTCIDWLHHVVKRTCQLIMTKKSLDSSDIMPKRMKIIYIWWYHIQNIGNSNVVQYFALHLTAWLDPTLSKKYEHLPDPICHGKIPYHIAPDGSSARRYHQN